MSIAGDDTIAAIATAAGVGGVGIVRVSGPDAVRIVADVLGVVPASLDRSVRVGWATNQAGVRIDQVIAFAMRAPSTDVIISPASRGGSHVPP